ncbi:MAG: hypothetical protein ACQEVA_05995 [Myxococcota bacterium]
MIDRARHLVVLGVMLLCSVAVPSTLNAAVPPAKVVEARLESAREAASDLDVDVDVETTGEDTGSISSFGVLGKRAKADNDAAFGWKLLFIVLTSSDPWTDLEKLAGSIDTSETDIDTQDGAFVYAYGGNPQVAVSRDLSVVRRVRVERDLARWDLVATGRLEGTPMPERVVLLKDGRPFARVALSLPDR